jgi:4-amino-4-deoxy-L-arabinose transferase-like glycosyltransferase
MASKLFQSKLFQSRYIILAIFLLIFFVRFAHLDADPSFVKRISDISDETVWGLDARNAILFDDWFIGDLHVGLDSAPLYMYLLFLFFKILGPSLFALRLLPAISGFLTAVVLYFFVKNLADRRQALLALCLFGFGNIVVVYNRLGHLESTLALFLLAFFVCWYYGAKYKSLFVLAGICYSLAILIKFSAILFFPALIIYWLFERHKKLLSWGNLFNKLILFCVGAIIPILLYLYLFLIPYWNQISESLITHGQNNFFGLTFALNSFKILGNNLFGLPTFVLMFFLLVLYMIWKLNQMEKFTLVELVDKSTISEGIALSWIIGGLIGILISDVSDRRFTIMFVPAVMLIAFMLFHWKDFSLTEFFRKISLPDYQPSILSKLFYYILIFFPVFSLPYLVLRLMGKNSVIFQQGSLAVLIVYILTVILFFFIDGLASEKSRKWLPKFLFFQFVFFLIFDPLTTLIRHFSKHFSIIFSTMAHEKSLVIEVTAIVLVIMMVIFSFLLINKNLFMRKPISITVIYFLLSLLLVGNVILAPNFTIMDGVNQLNEKTVPGSFIMGAAGEELLYGTTLLYLKYEPTHRAFHSLNTNIWDYKPRYYVDGRIFDGRKEVITPEIKIFKDVKSRYEINKIGTIPLYRYPFTQKYKAEFDLYALEGKSNQANT